jgi:hypothetical protein
MAVSAPVRGVGAGRSPFDERRITVLVRRLARPMLASVFVFSGANTLRNPVP